MARRTGVEPACHPVTFHLIRSQGGYRRLTFGAPSVNRTPALALLERTSATKDNRAFILVLEEEIESPTY